MTKGFSHSNQETIVSVIVKRLEPSAKRQDFHAFRDGLIKMQARYGMECTTEAFGVLTRQYDWLLQTTMNMLPKNTKEMFNAEAFDILAGVIADDGLRLEDHFRVSEKGMALTKEALNAIAKTGFPGMDSFGEGNESLEDVGIDRSPFIHPLSEFDKEEDHMNLWAAASVFISTTLGWVDPPSSNPEGAKSAIVEAVSLVSPTTDIDKMLHRARYDDRVLMRLTSFVEEGIRIKFDRAFGND